MSIQTAVDTETLEQLAAIFTASINRIKRGDRDEIHLALQDTDADCVIVYNRNKQTLGIETIDRVVQGCSAPIDEWVVRQTVDDSQLYTALECERDDTSMDIATWGPEAKFGPDGSIELRNSHIDEDVFLLANTRKQSIDTEGDSE